VFKSAIGIVAVLCSAALCSAGLAPVGTPTITVGTHALTPNEAGQTVQIYVTGGALVQGLEFNVQIAGSGMLPQIDGVDILTGTIFKDSNEGIFPGSYITPHLAYQGTTTAQTLDVGFGAGYVSTNGLLATLTIDTTGVTGGTFDLKLVGTPEGDTNFANIPAIVTNGTIAVPEPLSVSLLLAGSLGLLRRKR
jgi:hypothetical protein